MASSHETAIAIYYRALNRLAQRAGIQESELPVASLDPTLLEEAEKFALGVDGQSSGNEPLILRSLLGRLRGGETTGYYLPQIISSERASVLPKTDGLFPAEDATAAYQTLWTALQAELSARVVDSQPIEVQEANLYALLQRYAWAVPAPGVEDVSLFDAARTSAALAVCMQEAEAKADAPALLVGADLSGVQEWLYTLSSDGAARSLRGRSVYLQLLMEMVALDLLHEFGLPMASLLYVGGGNFYLLAPLSMKEQVAAYRMKAGKRLLDMHSGALYLALAATPLRADELTEPAVGKAWARISDKLTDQKARRFADLSAADMAKAIGKAMEGTGRPDRICRVCQRQMLPGEEGGPVTKNDLNPDERKCELCASFDELGGMLSSGDFLVVSRVVADTAQAMYHWRKLLHCFGADVQVLKKRAKKGDEWQSVATTLRQIYYWDDKLSALDFPGQVASTHTVWAFRPLAQAVPLNEDRWGNDKTATFSDLKSEGIDRWGVLRMDVDRLGDIFQKGIAPASLARSVSLSGLMRLFFEGYVPWLADQYNKKDRETNPDGDARIHLMYAGGDDLFIVGGWSWLPQLAAEIQQAFTQFVCGNPHVTISGGISIALAEKYPLYQAAGDAGEAEHQSKAYGRLSAGKMEEPSKVCGLLLDREPEKNALTFLGETMTWKRATGEVPMYDSYEWVSARVGELQGWLDGPDASLPRSFLMTLRAIDAEWREWKKREKGEREKQGIAPRYVHEDKLLYLGPWQWHLVYSLGRAKDRSKDETAKMGIASLQNQIINGAIRTIGLTSRWTEYLTRKHKETDV